MRVKWNGSLSGTFGASNGVKQSGVLSPLLFTVYLDQLILALKESGIGCSWSRPIRTKSVFSRLVMFIET